MKAILQRVSSRKEATEITHTLSNPSKVPCYGYSISALRCKVGATLVKTKDSVCNGCYALAGWYGTRIIIAEAMEKRYQSLFKPQWVEAMIFHIRNRKMAYFRWHDSGDIQGVWHLDLIAQVAMMCPDVKFWLPTREYQMVRDYWELNGRVPLNQLIPNLIIRISAHMIKQDPPLSFMAMVGVTGSSVVSKNETCHAQENTYISNNGQKKELHGYCGSCRKCWDQGTLIVNYKLHLAEKRKQWQ